MYSFLKTVARIALTLKSSKDFGSDILKEKHNFILQIVTGKMPVPLAAIDLPSSFNTDASAAFHRAL